MAKKVLRYTLTTKEQALWDAEEMQGWREAMEACVEDEAREDGLKKYVIYDRDENIIAKGEVRALVLPEASTP